VESGLRASAVATASALDEVLSCARHGDGRCSVRNDTRRVWSKNDKGLGFDMLSMI
jgi:hypothetical protein